MKKKACSFCATEHEGTCPAREKVMNQTTKINLAKTDRPNCPCGKPIKFHSSRLAKGFCSDNCYELAQRPNPAEPHIVRTRKDGAYFAQGDIKFPIDTINIDMVLGAGSCSHEPSCIEKLMDSQIASLAVANGFSVDPFVRALVIRPLHGIIQTVWYKDLGHQVDFDHLAANQARRVSDYNRLLTEYKPSDNGSTPRKQRSAKASAYANTYKIIEGKAPTAKGREQQVFDVLQKLGGSATLAQVVEAAKDQVKTKQPLEKICLRFLTALVSSGAVEAAK